MSSQSPSAGATAPQDSKPADKRLFPEGHGRGHRPCAVRSPGGAVSSKSDRTGGVACKTQSRCTCTESTPLHHSTLPGTWSLSRRSSRLPDCESWKCVTKRPTPSPPSRRRDIPPSRFAGERRCPPIGVGSGATIRNSTLWTGLPRAGTWDCDSRRVT